MIKNEKENDKNREVNSNVKQMNLEYDYKYE